MATIDTIYLNGAVLTMDAADNRAEAVAVSGGRIAAVGPNDEIGALAGPDTVVVDLAGRTLIPGFVDAHSHFPESGRLATTSVDLNSPPIGAMTSIDDLVAALRARAATTPAGAWIVGNGYDDSLLAEKRHPSRADLDRVSTAHPILAVHISHHLGAANSRALALLGIDRATPQPAGGLIRKDAASGEPDGVLEETALFSAVGQVPPPTEAQDLATIAAARDQYLAAGVTSAQNAMADTRLIARLATAAERGLLPLDVMAFPTWELALRIARGETRARLPANGRVKLGAAKVFQDGSIQGYTGYLSKPYHVPYKGDAGYRGYPIQSRERLTEIVGALHAEGLQIAIHGNGDAAIDDILHAFAAAQRAHPRPDARHILVHAQMARDDQLDTIKTLGVVPSFFTLHTYYWGDRHRDIFLGPARAARISPARSAVDRGLRFTIHCDTPVVPMTPLLLVWAAVNRLSTGGATIGADQRITALQALRAVTIDAAWQGFEEDAKGSIEPGKRADLLILSANPLTDPMAIKDIAVQETIIAGHTVHRAAPGQGRA